MPIERLNACIHISTPNRLSSAPHLFHN